MNEDLWYLVLAEDLRKCLEGGGRVVVLSDTHRHFDDFAMRWLQVSPRAPGLKCVNNLQDTRGIGRLTESDYVVELGCFQYLDPEVRSWIREGIYSTGQPREMHFKDW